MSGVVDLTNKELIDFNAGDTVKIHYKIIEGGKSRVQPFEGIVISKKGTGVSKTFTVRRIGADNIGVERIHLKAAKVGGPQISSANHKSENLRT